MRTKKILRRIRFSIFLLGGLIRKSNAGSSSNTSDLFIFRGGDWKTQFELLDLKSLISPAEPQVSLRKTVIHLFDVKGKSVGQKELESNILERCSLDINEYFSTYNLDEGLFAIEHKKSPDTFLYGAIPAERGYVGYGKTGHQILSYVHGNFDAKAFQYKKAKLLGRKSIFRRIYRVQHVLTNGAEYSFALVNSSSRPLRAKFQLRKNGAARTVSVRFIPAGGMGTFFCSGEEINGAVAEFVTSLYMARPVVFRQTRDSFDVFHG